MSIRSFKVFVRYELDGKEEEFSFFHDLNINQTDHTTASPLVDVAKSTLNKRLGWDADKITSFKAWWVERPVGEATMSAPNFSNLFSAEEIQAWRQAFWDSGEKDWSVSNDIPEVQQVDVMYPHRVSLDSLKDLK